MPHRNDLIPVVSAAVNIMVEPYRNFIRRLLAENRITQAEWDALQNDVLDNGNMFADLMRDELNKIFPPDTEF